MKPGYALALLLLSPAFQVRQVRDSTTCQSSIVSSTVVMTFCGHLQGTSEMMLDLLMVWRGAPGWFQNRVGAAGGNGGSSSLGRGLKGHVVRFQDYGDVTISYDADFDANTVTIGEETVPLNGINTILIDKIDRAGSHPISAKRWTAPQLPLGGDVNLVLAQHSRELLRDLQCEIPMPAPPAGTRQVPVITVCEKLKQR